MISEEHARLRRMLLSMIGKKREDWRARPSGPPTVNGCVTVDRYAGGFERALARVLKEMSTFKGGSALAWVLRISAAAAALLVTAFPNRMFAAEHLSLWHLRGHLYVVEDDFYAKENSIV